MTALLEAAWDQLAVLAGAPAPRLAAGPDPAAKVFEQQAEDYPASAMAWMHHASWKGPVQIPLDHIEPQWKWMDGASPGHVQDFVHRLKKGKKLKPVVCVKTPDDVKLLLVDGHHRYLACAEMGVPVRGYVGSVAADHGPWESMHDFQFDHGNGDEGGGDTMPASALDAAARLLREAV